LSFRENGGFVSQADEYSRIIDGANAFVALPDCIGWRDHALPVRRNYFGNIRCHPIDAVTNEVSALSSPHISSSNGAESVLKLNQSLKNLNRRSVAASATQAGREWIKQAMPRSRLGDRPR
jgi:hypothetical protein